MLEQKHPLENTWSEWKRLVLFQLETQDRHLKEIETKLVEMHVQIAQLHMKAGVWGLLAGIIPTLGALAVWAMSR